MLPAALGVSVSNSIARPMAPVAAPAVTVTDAPRSLFLRRLAWIVARFTMPIHIAIKYNNYAATKRGLEAGVPIGVIGGGIGAIVLAASCRLSFFALPMLCVGVIVGGWTGPLVCGLVGAAIDITARLIKSASACHKYAHNYMPWPTACNHSCEEQGARAKAEQTRLEVAIARLMETSHA